MKNILCPENLITDWVKLDSDFPIISIWEYEWQYALIWTKWLRSQLNTCLAESSRRLSENLGMYKTYLQQIKKKIEVEDKGLQTFSVLKLIYNCSRQNQPHIHQLRFAPSSGNWPYPRPLICFWLMTWQTLSLLLTFTSTDTLPPVRHSGLSGFQPRLNTFTDATGKFPQTFQGSSLRKYSSCEIAIFFLFF